MKRAGAYGPIQGGGYLIQGECETAEEANRLAGYLNRAADVERRLELAEAALREFAGHAQGVMATSQTYRAWRDYKNSGVKA